MLAAPRMTTPVVSREPKRAATANASKKLIASVKPATKRRAMTSQLEEFEMSEQATPIRRSLRIRTPTPKMVEARFGFFINAKGLPSRENPGIRSKRFKGDS
jgi:hypothetical protein